MDIYISMFTDLQCVVCGVCVYAYITCTYPTCLCTYGVHVYIQSVHIPHHVQWWTHQTYCCVCINNNRMTHAVCNVCGPFLSPVPFSLCVCTSHLPHPLGTIACVCKHRTYPLLYMCYLQLPHTIYRGSPLLGTGGGLESARRSSNTARRVVGITQWQ